VCGRRNEMLPHLMALVKADRVSLETLLDLGNPWTEYQDHASVNRFREMAPTDLLTNLVLAKNYEQKGEVDQAEALILALQKQQPQLIAAHARLGQMWMSTDPRKLEAWSAKLPPTADQSSEIWYVRGQWLVEQGRQREAIHCFLQSLRMDPNSSRLCTALAQSLSRIGDTAALESLQERATSLQVLNQTIDRNRRVSNYEPTIRQAAELTFKLRRYWECIGWCQYGMKLNTQSTWHKDLIEQTRKIGVLSANMPHTILPAEIDSLIASIEKYPAPATWQLSKNQGPKVANSDPNTTSKTELPNIRFENRASQMGIDFIYHNSFVDRDAGKRMFEFTGAGVGVLDYDRDGNPDLFLAQGTPWPIPDTASIPGDVLYRNLGVQLDTTVPNQDSIKFKDVSANAGIRERQFGQGVCVADIDGDGFDDVYVANFGENQLWLNQGDGTFRAANSLFEQSPHYWTVSAIAADLNGDGLVELFDVNYVMGKEVTSLRCMLGGKPRVCPPLVFSPAPQQLWIATEQGGFDRYNWAPKQQVACNGLGGVAFRSKGDQHPTLLVAVDQRANVLLRVNPNRDSKSGFLLEDEALLKGIAFDNAGQAQACMGIATGDVDRNGEVDFFVTNFYDESNTLYLQQDGLFSDATTKTGLVGPSRPMLGFGAQWLDADLDGDLDLAVLNGHIDDQSHVGVLEKMRPQFFLNTGNTQYTEYLNDRAGKFFGVAGLGRGLATVDLDRDGRLDLLATDLEAPFAILQNQSDQVGGYLAIELVGVKSDRNAFFSQVKVSAGDFESNQQLTSGSGYLVSNERCLTFSIPKDKQVVDVTVEWPNGNVEQLSSIPVNQRITVVEGLTARHVE
jgi:tetratricopeptide (TPR) repeat protein